VLYTNTAFTHYRAYSTSHSRPQTAAAQSGYILSPSAVMTSGDLMT